MSCLSEQIRHASALLSLQFMQRKAIDQFNPSEGAAWRSFWLWLVIIPAQLFAVWIAYRPIIAVEWQFFYLHTVQLFAALVLPLLPIWLFCRWQNLADRFPLYVTSQNWLYLFWALLGALLNGMSANMVFPASTIITISIIMFYVNYANMAYFAWLALRSNFLVAIGVASITSIIMAMTSDVLNIHLFGSARPLIGQ